MTKAYRIVRQSPTDLDDESPVAATGPPQFDYRHKGGSKPWPEKHKFTGIKFGPALIKAAWKGGLTVIAYVEGFPHPVAITETRWNVAKCFEVKTLEGWKLPERIRTLKNVKGLQSTGEYTGE